MAATTSSQAPFTLSGRPHPLHHITPDEIKRAASIVSVRVRATDGPVQVRFKNISLQEPPKALLLPYLDAEAAGVPHSQRPFVPRSLSVTWSTGNERRVTDSVVSLDANTVVEEIRARPGQHGSIDRYVVVNWEAITHLLTGFTGLRHGILVRRF
jgi:primary-amine oxidase